MKQFDVLSRTENLHCSRLLEASAGTGKTHAIENIVIRLLIDRNSPLVLEKILVVTFTRVATEDLKVRIRTNLSTMVSFCKRFLKEGNFEGIPEYLEAIFEEGREAVVTVQRRLEQALVFFDRAQIFTIHSFCLRMLKEFLFEGNSPVVQREIAKSQVYQLIRDFFRTEVTDTLITPEQLNRVLIQLKGIEGLEKKLYALAMGGADISSAFSLDALKNDFYAAMSKLRQSFCMPIQSHLLLEDFFLLAPAYKEICDIKKQPKAENVAKVKRFAALAAKESWDCLDFDLLLRDGIYWLQAFSAENRDKRKQLPRRELLHYPDLTSQLEQLLQPTIALARNSEKILATLAARCRKMLKQHFEQEEILHFDTLLDGMQEALKNNAFLTAVRDRFAVAIIDEFQDTDPIQWDIFKTLFLTAEKHRLYLVGDPKQSIYAFRQANVYTYLEAAELLGQDLVATLGTNYRSTAPLTEALNYLFSLEMIEGVMVLPRAGKTIPYAAVKSSGNIFEKSFGNERKSVNFCIVDNEEKKTELVCEEEYFFPFIARELIDMQRSGSLSFSECAVLVADHRQAARLGEYFREMGIPYILQRNKSIVASTPFFALKELLEAILHPRSESALKVALGGPICAWKEADFSLLENLKFREEIVAIFVDLRKMWKENGFARLFYSLIHFCFPSNSASIVEGILSRSGGDEFYRTLEHIASLLSEAENRLRLHPHQLIAYFDELEKMEMDEEGITKCISDGINEAVAIMTIHSSKGLEFEVVFSLGTIKSGKSPGFLFPSPRSGKRAELRVADGESDPEYAMYRRELEAEKLRQLYVAWTRAKQRLYIPLLLQQSSRRSQEPSAMELYLAQLKKRANQQQGVLAAILGRELVEEEKLAPVLSSNRHSICCIRLNVATNSSAAAFTSLSPEVPMLSPALEPQIPAKPQFLCSFTSLLSQITSSAPQKLMAESPPPHDFLAGSKTAHTLPAGTDTGNLLHSILEAIPFALGQNGSRNGALTAFVNRFLIGTPFAPWEDIVVDVVYSALTAIFPSEEGYFSLQDLEEWKSYREHEFLYPSYAFSDISLPPGHLKGVIDLIFSHKGKYYIVDWKSTWLGPNQDAYSAPSMTTAMGELGYYFQAKIYLEAVKRYLSLCDSRPFEESFGGVYYLFLRALKPGSSEGVYKI